MVGICVGERWRREEGTSREEKAKGRREEGEGGRGGGIDESICSQLYWNDVELPANMQLFRQLHSFHLQ